MSQNFDETTHLQSERRHKLIQKARAERPHGTANGWSGAPRQANSLAVSLSGKNEWPRTHYTVIEKKEERKDSNCRMFQRA